MDEGTEPPREVFAGPLGGAHVASGTGVWPRSRCRGTKAFLPLGQGTVTKRGQRLSWLDFHVLCCSSQDQHPDDSHTSEAVPTARLSHLEVSPRAAGTRPAHAGLSRAPVSGHVGVGRNRRLRCTCLLRTLV